MKNECIKNTKELLNKFILEINQYKDENKNKKDFLKNVKKYNKNLADKYIKDFEAFLKREQKKLNLNRL